MDISHEAVQRLGIPTDGSRGQITEPKLSLF